MIYAQPSAAFSSTAVAFPTGLVGTMGVRVINAATGATTIARTTSGITEAVAGSGTYLAQITAPSAPGRYLVQWDSGTETPSTTAAEDLVVSTSVGLNGEFVLSGNVNYTGPVAASGAVSIVVGDDYASADNRQLKFVDTAGLWPTITGATISLIVSPYRGSPATLTAAGTVAVGSGPNKEADVALTHAQTLTLTPGVFYSYALVATLTDTNVVTLSRGTLTALGQPV